MSESDILEHLFSLYDRFWVIIQWWASISFSIIVVGYFAAARLNGRVIGLLLFLYTVYTAYIAFLLVNIGQVMDAFIASLHALEKTGEALNAGTQVLISHPLTEPGQWLGLFAFVTTYLCCSGYLFFSYRKAKSEQDE